MEEEQDQSDTQRDAFTCHLVCGPFIYYARPHDSSKSSRSLVPQVFTNKILMARVEQYPLVLASWLSRGGSFPTCVISFYMEKE